MKCYYHPDREAVAVCSVCGKPLCAECAHEYKRKIYCKDCLAKVKEEEKVAASKSDASEDNASKNSASSDSEKTASKSAVSENTGMHGTENKTENETPPKMPHKKTSTAKIVFVSIVIAFVIIGLILLSTAGIFSVLTPAVFKPTLSRVESVSSITYGNEQKINISTDINNCMLNVGEIENATDKRITEKNAESAKLAELTSVNAIVGMSYKDNTLTVKATGLKKKAVVNLYITDKIREISFGAQGKNAFLSITLPYISINNFKVSVTNGGITLSDCSLKHISGSTMNDSIEITNSSVTEISLKGMNSHISFNDNKLLGNVSLNLLNGVLDIKGNKRITSFDEKGVNSKINCDFSETTPPMNTTFRNITTEVTIDVGKQPAVISAPYVNVNADSYFTVNGSDYTTPNYSEQSPHLSISVLPGGGTVISLGSITLLGGE